MTATSTAHTAPRPSACSAVRAAADGISSTAVEYAWRGEFRSAEVNVLHAEAFGGRVYDEAAWPWRELVAANSLGWCVARRAGDLVGFANVVSDGLVHAWLQDVMVSSALRGCGVGRALVALAAEHARAAGCEILHADFDPELSRFYVDTCGFTPTSAALLDLTRPTSP